MEIACRQLVPIREDGVVGAAAEFAVFDGYFLLQAPTPENDEFFGATHYVEINDQAFGAYGGLTALRLSDDGRRLSVRLAKALPDLGADLELVFDAPIDPGLSKFLRGLEI